MIQGQSPEPRSLESLLKSFPIDKMACDITPNVDIAPAREVYAIIRFISHLDLTCFSQN